MWGDVIEAEEALQVHPNLTTRDFFAACLGLDVGSVESMIKSSGQPEQLVNDAGGARQWQPLLYTTWSGFHTQRREDANQVVELLLEHGADPNAGWKNKEDDVEESALYGCVEANNPRAARLLLDAGSNVNDGESLYHACEQGNLELLQVLGDFGLNQTDVSYCIKHAIDYRWDDGIAWFLAHGADPNAVHPASDETSLHWAIKRGCSLATIEALLSHGADPNAKTQAGESAFLGLKGWTPYDFALRLGQTDVSELLRNQGAVASEQDLVDQFVIACASGDRKRVATILESDADCQARLDSRDQRLIAHVAQCKRWNGVKLMVESGWRPDQDGGWMGATPLTWAACYGQADLVEFLLRHGASPTVHAGDYFGDPVHTVLHCRWGSGDYANTLELLLDAGASVESYERSGDDELDKILNQRSNDREK